MSSQDQIIETIIKPCLEKANVFIPHVEVKNNLENVIFYGQEQAILDSLNLVNFIFLIEEQVLEVYKTNLKFETEDILNTELKPFLNVNNLSKFLELKMKAAK